MARDRGREGIYVEKPKPDIYLALLVFTSIATIAATVFMYMAGKG
jgi:hypothetical protein